MIIGDLNVQIGNDEFGVTNNKDKISVGGKFFRNLIISKKYFILNNKAISEPWTWMNRQDIV